MQIPIEVKQRIHEADARIAELEQQLALALDAAAKGDLARANAGGMEMRIQELEKALRAMSDMYGYVWDRVDGALVCMPENIKRFDAAHEQAQRALMVR